MRQATSTVLSTRPDVLTSGKPELSWLLACVRGEASEIPLHQQRVDWEQLLDAAERHSVVPQVRTAVAGNAVVPAQIREELESRFRSGFRRNLVLTAELMRLLEVFKESGIKVLPYKGPVLAQELYGDIGARTFSDLDLLVRPADVPHAIEALASSGYQPDPPIPVSRLQPFLNVASEQMFRRTTGAALVELQWQLAPRYFAVDTRLDWLWNSTVPAKLEGREVLSLTPEALLLVLSVHGAKHQWERIGWVADVAQLLRRYPSLNFGAALHVGRGMGVERLVLLALELADRAFGARVPEAIRRRVGWDRAVPGLCQAVEEGWLREAHGVPGLGGHLFTLHARERWRDRVHYIARLALTPNPRDWAMLRLPDLLSPLYFLLRPGLLLARAVRATWRRVSTTVATASSGAKAPHRL